MKAVILARVSTEEQKEAGNSLPAQQARLVNYVQKSYSKTNGSKLILDKQFVFDESAYKEHRKEFQKVIDYVVSHKEVVAFCCDKVDRLSRDFLIGLPQLEKLRREGKIELHFPSDNLVLHKDSPATDLFHFNIAVSLAQYYSNAIGDNVKRAFEQKRRNGEWTGTAPIGYMSVALDAGKRLRKDIVLDPDRAHLIKALFELYSSGNYSITTLWNKVTEMGLRSRKGAELSRAHIHNILNDPFYYGQPYSRKHGLYATQHPYPKLITKELYDKCQEVQSGRSKSHSKMVSNDQFIFKGLLPCVHCGCLMSPEIKIKKSGLKYVYYSCTNAKGNCKKVYVPESMLLKPVYDVLEGFSKIPKEVQERLVLELRKAHEGAAEFHEKEVKRIQSEYNRLQKRLDELLDMRLDQSITKNDYDKKQQELRDKQNLLNIELEEHTHADHQYHIHVDTVFNLARRMKEIFVGSEPLEKRAFLNFLLQNPTVDGKKLDFTLRKPFNLLLDLSDYQTGLRLLDSNQGPTR